MFENNAKISNFIQFFYSFFGNVDFLILHVSWPENARNGMKEIYPTGYVKKKRIWIFSNFREVSKMLEFSNFFLTLPLDIPQTKFSHSSHFCNKYIHNVIFSFLWKAKKNTRKDILQTKFFLWSHFCNKYIHIVIFSFCERLKNTKKISLKQNSFFDHTFATNTFILSFSVLWTAKENTNKKRYP